MALKAKTLKGKVCRKHPELQGERYASGHQCIKCVRETGKEYSARNAEKEKERLRKWSLDHKEQEAERLKIWRITNQNQENERSRQYRIDHPDKARKATEKYRLENKDKSAAKTSHRRAVQLRATPLWANQFIIGEAYHLAKLRGKVCGGKWHVDHIVPMNSKIVCGLHVEHNLRVIPGAENIRKSNRHWPNMPD